MRVLTVFCALFIAVNAVPFLKQLDEPFEGKTWVVLCASADTWINYGMPADIYHAYHVIKDHGIPDENIIVMHYDDIAQHPQNPSPGIVINRPDGPDVYYGVPKHYISKDVTPKNFLGVISGDPELKKQGKKVVESGPNDRIFVYLEDHGAKEVVSFPTGGMLHAKELNQVLTKMHTDKKFAKLVIYIDACESGSMFDKLLPNDINVYAVSATKPDELGWKAYHEKTKYFTYLALAHNTTHVLPSKGSLCEQADLTKESVEAQYQYLKEHNNFTMDGELHTQHAQEYGDLTIAKNEHVGQYMGDKKIINSVNTVQPEPTGFSLSRDAAINIVKHKIEATDDAEMKQAYIEELMGYLSRREVLDKQIEEYVNTLPGIEANVVLNEKLELNNRECYIKLVDTFYDKCYNIGENTYALNKMHVFVNICESSAADIAVNSLSQFCDRLVKPSELLVIAVNAVPIDEHLNDNEFKGTKWVVLVAGAPGWGDYASQSSVYHAYQVVHANGIPDENIIVFHPDDIANNSLNPTPGKIIDHPCGDDVYHGVPKDYTGNDVNPTTFINVLKGSQELASKGKKVLNSGPNDHVFIYFLDHGADEIILFQRKYLHAKDLNDALIEMHQNKRFGKLVFYLEACESGSMFNKLLPKDINVYAITSSTPTKMSGKMYPDKYYHTTIGSFFAHYWLLNDEQADLNKETLQQQFDYIYKWTNTPGQVDAENFTQQAQQYDIPKN
ncbi:unnamed protein product [Medioppia subpectinata]|uniref:legumain n=1 Tax=Medioppia subpectinata TaxID=1979941 RepID=A0A7R9PXU2_9ACAR|nr:unnamed protein product [Medioppia subpectinata]CAG2105162.1 unnamed protein product [Medioppia subpectinata]